MLTLADARREYTRRLPLYPSHLFDRRYEGEYIIPAFAETTLGEIEAVVPDGVAHVLIAVLEPDDYVVYNMLVMEENLTRPEDGVPGADLLPVAPGTGNETTIAELRRIVKRQGLRVSGAAVQVWAKQDSARAANQSRSRHSV